MKTLTDRRYRAYLGGRYRSLTGYVGVLLSIIGVLIVAPAGLVLIFPAESSMIPGFLWPGLGLLFLGIILIASFRPKNKDSLSIAEGSAVVVIAWSAAITAGAVPFLLAGLNLTPAIFETTSGWTTTGLSVIDTSRTSPLLLFYRSLMQLAGGAGLAILMLSTIAGPAGVGLSTAEGRGEQLVPQVRQSARLVLQLYGIYTLLGIAGLKLAGMQWFDAVNHTFCAVSTGGFSTRAASAGSFDSPAIEAVLIVLMILGTTNFLTAYTLWHGRWRAVVRNGELRVMAFMLPAAAILLFFGVPFYADNVPGQARAAIFQAVSAISTTGYDTVSFSGMNSFGLMIIIVLMLIGGGTGSTAGGIKQHRIYLLFKGLKREFSAVFLPAGTISEEVYWMGNHRKPLLESDLWKTGMYIALYLFTWLAGGCALSAFGHPLADSLFEFASALGTVGLSVGITAAASDGQLWLMVMGMLLGRLEFFVIFWGIAKIARDLAVLAPGR